MKHKANLSLNGRPEMCVLNISRILCSQGKTSQQLGISIIWQSGFFWGGKRFYSGQSTDHQHLRGCFIMSLSSYESKKSDRRKKKRIFRFTQWTALIHFVLDINADQFYLFFLLSLQFTMFSLSFIGWINAITYLGSMLTVNLLKQKHTGNIWQFVQFKCLFGCFNTSHFPRVM